MKWIHEGIEITISEDGMFEFTLGNTYKSNSLNDAKAKINSMKYAYYKMSNKDIKTLLGKLKNREKDFVTWLMTELENHRNNPYCDRGIYGDWNYELEKDELEEIN